MNIKSHERVGPQAFLSIRRAFRLGTPEHALAPASVFASDRDELDLNVRLAAEQAGLSARRADHLLEWLRLRLVPGYADEMKENRRSYIEALGLPAQPPIEFGAIPLTLQNVDALDELPAARIEVRPGRLTEMVAAAEAALIETRADLFQRAGDIVRITYTDDETPRMHEVDETHLADLIGRAAEFYRFDARSRQWRRVGCPREVAQAYLARPQSERRLPVLNGIIHAPMLNADGTVRSFVGFDRFGTDGLFLADGTGQFDAVPTYPSQRDADDAADEISGLLDEFPFVADQDHSVAVAAILTAVVRRSLPTAPLFAFTAPAAGTGKSSLVDLVGMISTGQPARGMTWPDDPHEQRKQLDAALLEGAPAVHLDNVRAPLGGDRLNQMLTQASASVRVLGQSKNVEVPCGAFCTANGNNLVIEADLTRRTLLCSMDARVERPELRQFRGDPLATVAQDRPRYVAAALTILRAYHVAGRPNQPKPLGSFEAWSSLVRGALLWVGYADPVASMDAAREVDPRGAELVAVLGEWNDRIGDRRVTSAEVIEAACGGGSGGFREALFAVAGVAGSINTKRLGMWLQANKGRVAGALSIIPAGKNRTNTAVWALSGARPACEVVRFPPPLLP